MHSEQLTMPGSKPSLGHLIAKSFCQLLISHTALSQSQTQMSVEEDSRSESREPLWLLLTPAWVKSPPLRISTPSSVMWEDDITQPSKVSEIIKRIAHTREVRKEECAVLITADKICFRRAASWWNCMNLVVIYRALSYDNLRLVPNQYDWEI